MEYYIILFKNGSLKICKVKQDKTRLPQGARLFVCSRNIGTSIQVSLYKNINKMLA